MVAALLLAASAVGATASVTPSRVGVEGTFFPNTPAGGATLWQQIKSNYAPFSVGPTGSEGSETTQNETQLPTLNHRVAAAINAFRVAHGLTPLTISPELNASARQHSMEMGAKGYFDHNSYNGTAWWKRIQSYYTANGFSYWTAGENLLWSTGYISAADSMKLWIGSPEHLRNLKDPNWRDLGVSAVHVLHAKGVYGGYTVTIITTDFGARHS